MAPYLLVYPQLPLYAWNHVEMTKLPCYM